MKPKTHLSAKAICLGLLVTLCDVSAASLTVVVRSTSDPWLAGMPNGSTASGTDMAPAQSPVLATGLSFARGAALIFSATGGVGNSPVSPQYPPEGNLLHIPPHGPGAENGIASVVAPMNSLVGIFLGARPAKPDSSATTVRSYHANGPRLSLTATSFETGVLYWRRTDE